MLVLPNRENEVMEAIGAMENLTRQRKRILVRLARMATKESSQSSLNLSIKNVWYPESKPLSSLEALVSKKY